MAKWIIPLALSATLSVAGTVSAQTTGLEDFVGARAGQAENGIRTRGYRFVRAEQGDDRSYTFWWNADRRQCVTIATMDGRYASIQPTPPPDCQQSASVRTEPSYGGEPASRPRPGYEPDPESGRRGYDQGGYPDDRPTVDGRYVDLGLVCLGDGSKTGLATGTAWTWNRDRDRYEHGRYTETQRQVFDASITIQTWPGGGRIRLPKSMIPPINSRGDQGWWDLYDVSIDPDTISAVYRLNGLNKPRLTIDRRSGRITIRGTADYGFRGTCDQIAHAARRF